jgi:hypothetical protein
MIKQKDGNFKTAGAQAVGAGFDLAPSQSASCGAMRPPCAPLPTMDFSTRRSHPAFDVGRWTFDVRRFELPAFNFQHSTSNFQLSTSSVQVLTRSMLGVGRSMFDVLNFQHSTSNIQLPTSNFQPSRPGAQPFDVGRWMFYVRRF